MSLSKRYSGPFAARTLQELQTGFARRAAELDTTRTVPAEHFALLHEAGLIGYTAPQPIGPGATLQEAREVIAAIAYAEPSTALILTMSYLLLRQIGAPGSRWPQAVRDQVLQSAVSDGALINILRVEPELGTPARGGLPATVARRTGDGWRLSGHKLYSTGSTVLRWLAVWARTDEAEPRTGLFLVDRAKQQGIEIRESWNHLGLRASGSHDVILNEVWTPLDHAVDIRLPQAWQTPQLSAVEKAVQVDHQAWTAVLLSTLYDAIASAGYDWLLDFLNTRVPSNLGAALSSLPRVQEGVGRIAEKRRINAVLLQQAASAADAGTPAAIHDSWLLKLTVTSNAIDSVEQALRLSGNAGLTRNNPLERHYRDVLCGRVHTPQDDTAWLAAGKEALAQRADIR